MAIRGAASAGRRLLSGETNLAALFHFLSKTEHGFLCDVASFPARKRSFGIIEGCRDVGTDRGGRLAGQGEGERDRKREDDRHAICCGGQDQS